MIDLGGRQIAIKGFVFILLRLRANQKQKTNIAYVKNTHRIQGDYNQFRLSKLFFIFFLFFFEKNKLFPIRISYFH